MVIIIITGAIGIGKTTVCEKVIELVRSSGYSCGGILTHKAAYERLIASDIQTGERMPYSNLSLKVCQQLDLTAT
jgi:nucleoside-triphosphatase THEP1